MVPLQMQTKTMTSDYQPQDADIQDHVTDTESEDGGQHRPKTVFSDSVKGKYKTWSG